MRPWTAAPSMPLCWCRRLTNWLRNAASMRSFPFNEVMNISLGGLAVHTQKIKEKPDEIVRMIKAILKSVDYIRTHKSEILSIMETKWGIKEAEIRDGIYRDIVGIYSRNGIATDETMKNVVQLVRDTRKTKDDTPMSNIFDWSFARKAQQELKIK